METRSSKTSWKKTCPTVLEKNEAKPCMQNETVIICGL